MINENDSLQSTIRFLSGLLLILGAILIIPYGDFRVAESVPKFALGIAVMSLGFILSWRLDQIRKLEFWTVTLLSRLLLLFMYSGDDIWRYLWEGYIQTYGFSPYNFAPNAVELFAYRTDWWIQINHPDISAIYPPLAQLGFRFLASISTNVILFKSAFILADLLICWLLSRRFGYSKTLLYAWNPLVIYAFAGGGHYDSWFILSLVAAWLLFERGQKVLPQSLMLSSLLLGISVAVKWISLPMLSFFIWQAFKKVNLKLAMIVLLLGLLPLSISAIPFCISGNCPLIPTGSDFVSHGRSAELLPYLIGLIWERSQQANWIYLIYLGIAGLFLLWKTRTFQQFAEAYFFVLLTISPIIHAWYFTWIIPFSVATQNLGVRLVSLSAFIYFVLPYRQALGNNEWYLNIGERLLLWLPFLVGFLWTRKSPK